MTHGTGKQQPQHTTNSTGKQQPQHTTNSTAGKQRPQHTTNSPVGNEQPQHTTNSTGKQQTTAQKTTATAYKQQDRKTTATAVRVSLSQIRASRNAYTITSLDIHHRSTRPRLTTVPLQSFCTAAVCRRKVGVGMCSYKQPHGSE
ncbi:uncharacterized protein [Macrobrachium rosenbergii]|uniref:uncharacterized protein n=1 Tax=Macrobrachium rosenbergii TaxID=79674 RepID=UPI0034D3983B